MKWNAFSNLEPAIKKTKKLLFPFSFLYWLKLAFVSLFSSYGSIGSGFNFNVPSGSFPDEKSFSNVFGGSLLSFITSVFFMIIVIIFMIFVLITQYISSVFSFIFLEALYNKKYSIIKSWKKHHKKGISFFLFNISIMILSLIVIGIIAIVPIINIINAGGFIDYFKTYGISGFFIGMLPFILLAILWVIILNLIITLCIDFGLPRMYKKNIRITKALKQIYSKVKNQKIEILIYLVAKIVYGIVIGIIVFFITIVSLLIFILIGGIIGAILFLILMMISKAIAIVVVVIIGIILFLIYLLTIFLLTLPFTVFIAYFSIECYENFSKKRYL